MILPEPPSRTASALHRSRISPPCPWLSKTAPPSRRMPARKLRPTVVPFLASSSSPTIPASKSTLCRARPASIPRATPLTNLTPPKPTPTTKRTMRACCANWPVCRPKSAPRDSSASSPPPAMAKPSPPSAAPPKASSWMRPAATMASATIRCFFSRKSGRRSRN